MKHRLRRTNVIGAILAGSLAVGAASAATPASVPARGNQQAAVRAVVQRTLDAWARNDASGVAAVFARDTEFVVGDGTYLNGRSELRAYMQPAFAGPLKGTRTTATVVSVRFLKRDVAVMHTRGGILFPGETEVPPERRGVQVWVVTEHRGAWLVSAYQNTRITPVSP